MNAIRKQSLWLSVNIAVLGALMLFPLLTFAQSAGTSASFEGSVDATVVYPVEPASNQATFFVSPSSGVAPLAVTFSSSLTDPERYTIDFGDGTTGAYSRCAESYPLQCSTSHVYRAAGTYNAQLIYDVCPRTEALIQCMAPSQIVASATVVVRGSSTTNVEIFTANPTRGQAPLVVNFASSLAEPQRYKIDFGDGTTGVYSVCAKSYPAQCSASHTYKSTGVYQATLIKDVCPVGAMCFVAAREVGKVTITVSQNLPPVDDADGVITNNPGDEDPNYWTPERMRDAQPMGMSVYNQESSYRGWFGWVVPFVTFSWLPFW